MSICPKICPHCGRTAGPHHYRDSGNLTPYRALELGYCPDLADKRAQPLAPIPELIHRVIRQAGEYHALYLTIEESAELLAYTSGDRNVAIWTGTGDVTPIEDLEWHILPEIA